MKKSVNYEQLKKRQYNKIAYAKKLYQKSEGYKKQVIEAEINTLQKDYELLKHSIAIIKASQKNKKVRTKQAEIKIKDLIKKQKKQQPISKRVNYKVASHIEAKITNIILENDFFDIDKKSLENINKIFKKTLNYDLMEDIRNIFDIDKNISSGDAYEGLTDIVDDVSSQIENLNKTTINKKELEELVVAFDKLRRVL